jgi:hypothetical protein
LVSVRRAIWRAALRAEAVLAMKLGSNLTQKSTAARAPAASGVLIVRAF